VRAAGSAPGGFGVADESCHPAAGRRPGIISDDYFDAEIVRGTELAASADTTREGILKEAGYKPIPLSLSRS